ncbi:hypothetical protein TcWFU_001100 [Taenia crassiceps]
MLHGHFKQPLTLNRIGAEESSGIPDGKSKLSHPHLHFPLDQRPSGHNALPPFHRHYYNMAACMKPLMHSGGQLYYPALTKAFEIAASMHHIGDGGRQSVANKCEDTGDPQWARRREGKGLGEGERSYWSTEARVGDILQRLPPSDWL